MRPCCRTREFLSTREYAKESRPFRSALFRACGLSNIQGTFHRFLFKYFFLSKSACAWGRNSSVRSLRSRDEATIDCQYHTAPLAQHLLLQMHSMSITPECYSGILVKNTPSFRKGLGVGYICCFLRFSFSFTPLIPCPLPPTEEREMTERTPTQLPANKKCCLFD